MSAPEQTTGPNNASNALQYCEERESFYPNGQQMYRSSEACGITANRDFEAHRQDENGF